jgi:hypothetical protein
MRSPETRDYSTLIVHDRAQPPKSRPLPRPVRARCVAATYGGGTTVAEGVVTHRAGDLLAFEYDAPGWGRWVAWVRAERCRPLASNR